MVSVSVFIVVFLKAERVVVRGFPDVLRNQRSEVLKILSNLLRDKQTPFFIRTHNITLAANAAIMVSIVRSIGGYKPRFPIPQTQSAFHLRAQ